MNKKILQSPNKLTKLTSEYFSIGSEHQLPSESRNSQGSKYIQHTFHSNVSEIHAEEIPFQINQGREKIKIAELDKFSHISKDSAEKNKFLDDEGQKFSFNLLKDKKEETKKSESDIDLFSNDFDEKI